MKKLLLTAALLFASYGVFADEFDDFVATMKRQSAGAETVVRANRAKRIVFFDTRINQNSKGITQEIFDSMKPQLEKDFRKKLGPEGIKFLKRNNISLVFRFVMLDGKRFRVAITPRDL